MLLLSTNFCILYTHLFFFSTFTGATFKVETDNSSKLWNCVYTNVMFWVEIFWASNRTLKKNNSFHVEMCVLSGEVSDSDDSDSSQEEFNDGYDDELMGDAEDRIRLMKMSEKEREQEIYQRLEQREIKKKRFEIEKKLRQNKKQGLKKQKEEIKKHEKGSSSEDHHRIEQQRGPDPKERSKDRKKTIEEKQDKKFAAMSLLKARREERRERGAIER